MDNILLLKLLGLVSTAYYMSKNPERNSNLIGGCLILSFGLTLLGIGAFTAIAIIIYTLTLIVAGILIATRKIQLEYQALVLLFFIVGTINTMTNILYLPVYGMI